MKDVGFFADNLWLKNCKHGGDDPVIGTCTGTPAESCSFAASWNLRPDFADLQRGH